MSWIGKLLLNIALWGIVRQLEKIGSKDRIEAKAKEYRRYVEDRLNTLATRKQKGKLADTVLDDNALYGAQVFMKSRWLDQKLRAINCH